MRRMSIAALALMLTIAQPARAQPCGQPIEELVGLLMTLPPVQRALGRAAPIQQESRAWDRPRARAALPGPTRAAPPARAETQTAWKRRLLDDARKFCETYPGDPSCAGRDDTAR